MDMLYRAYSNPLDLMNLYINQGRFGKFVKGFLEAEYEKRKEKAEQDNEWKLWLMYVHSYSEMTFSEWKSQAIKESRTNTRKANKDDELTDDGIQSIVGKLFPS
jgi:hypothetical protein